MGRKIMKWGLVLLLTLVVSYPLLLWGGIRFSGVEVNVPVSEITNAMMPSIVGDIVASFDKIPDDAQVHPRLKAPGFRITLFATGLKNPRLMHQLDSGHMLVSVPRSGTILLMEPDMDLDGKSDGVTELLTDLYLPHGVLVDEGYLYVGETHRLVRYKFNEQTLQVASDAEHLLDLPERGNHWTRTVRLGPDGRLYINVGSTCNVCNEDHPWRGGLVSVDKDGTHPELFASGLRNTVGWDWHPKTQELFGVDNGRDLLGDDYPPCELNLIVEGGFYGWPYRNGFNDPDPDFGGKSRDVEARSIMPVHGFPAHTAPLAIKFLKKDSSHFRSTDALVTLHGSWNRSKKQGYEVVKVSMEDGKYESTPFFHGFEYNEDVIGRPVDVLVADDGSIYVTDDFGGAIYRLLPN